MNYTNYFNTLSRLILDVDVSQLQEIASRIVEASNQGGKVLIFGNGGSSAIASHLSVDLSNAAGIPANAYCDSAMITCLSNDYGYENWITKVVEIYGMTNDVAIFISSSGESENMIKGSKTAAARGIKVFTFSGFKPDNRLSRQGLVNMYCASEIYNVVENVHQAWVLSIVDSIRGLEI